MLKLVTVKILNTFIRVSVSFIKENYIKLSIYAFEDVV